MSYGIHHYWWHTLQIMARTSRTVRHTDRGLHHIRGADQVWWFTPRSEANTMLWRAPGRVVHATDGGSRHTVAHTLDNTVDPGDSHRMMVHAAESGVSNKRWRMLQIEYSWE